ncbi:glycoside hydrolase 5 family protein [Geofilum sp. OHC36d9]|uniref:glycoside hydrolase 5 family protein n=1 Tax=Geofilum sp. OHC36d9 TaxID=3458413 RepID=UPI004033F3FD
MNKVIGFFFFVFVMAACSFGKSSESAFVKVNDGQFTVNGRPYYFVGTNYWYGAILGSEGEGGNRERLIKELDLMQSVGITNLRVLVGAEGGEERPWRVWPALITEPGVYNDTILDGLDFFMAELAKRKMYAVLFLNNSWEWSGGYSQYLKWNGYGDIPYPQEGHSWSDFMTYVSQFHSCQACIQQNYDFIEFIINRNNRYTGVAYKDDPTVMTWEIANEPRAFSDDNKEAFAHWVRQTASFIKELAPNQLVTTGSEGEWGCEQDMDLFTRIHADENVDYLTFHIWPNNWSWIDKNDIPGTLDVAIDNTATYFENHIKVARELNKPVVFEEFGLPRDNFSFLPGTPTTSRDRYYQFAFDMVLKHARTNDVLGGVNFWAFGGYAQPVPRQVYWKKGDDLMGDPPQEEQGLNAVFAEDSTMNLIRIFSDQLKGELGK